MKFLLLQICFLSLSINTMAADSADLAGCKGAAVKAAIVFARSSTSNPIHSTTSYTSNVTGRGKNMISTYAIDLKQCDESGCGGLSYDVVIRGQHPSCKILRVEMTGEE